MENKPAVCGRFAPSPSGRMHLGNLWSCLLAWLAARSHGGRMVLRLEDLDPDRCTQAWCDQVMRDLEWLGLTWDNEPVYQSERTAVYAQAFRALEERGLIYPCYCTRAERLAASAPHRSDGRTVYDGRCRDLTDRARRELARLEKNRVLQDPINYILDRRALLEDLRRRLVHGLGGVMAGERERFARLAAVKGTEAIQPNDGRFTILRDQSEWMSRHAHEVEKFCMFFHSVKEAQQYLPRFTAIEGVEVVQGAPDNIEVTAAGVNKGESLLALADHLGIPREATLAVGDSENDRAMLEKAGVAAVMANGMEQIRKLADIVSENDNDHDGVAEIFARLGL